MPRFNPAVFLQKVSALLLLLASLLSSRAFAGTARFIAGEGWGVSSANTVNWKVNTLQYYTDQGPLSPTVGHAAADSLVAAAAGVWNVPTSSLTLTQGGQLAEDVTSQTAVVTPAGVVLPPDTQPLNEGQMPIAVIYDADGTLIDLLLGEGASEPEGCLQNGVIGDLDDIHQNDGSLRHATLILNGRCVADGTTDELLQMQYQLTRSFGRVLGLSWSQTNDDVFTETTPATPEQMAFWPLMHPLDLICGNYTYQCMTNPFQLRVDDLNTLAILYPTNFNNPGAGKQATGADAVFIYGLLNFPNGQGMAWANVVAHRQHNGVNESWQTTSALSGFATTQAIATPIDPGQGSPYGRNPSSLDGYFYYRRVPVDGLSNLFFTSEAVNPLYVGDLALGSYGRPPVQPSGSPATMYDWSALSTNDLLINSSMTANDAAAECDPGADGTETAPASPAASGWQTGQLCGWGHSSWLTLPIAAGHSWTYEVTATDEHGVTTLNKAQPVLGVWQDSDATGTAPTVATMPVSFNSLSPGTTQLQMDAPDADASYRIAISDQFGAGRPDFTYTGRFLYASSVSPGTLGQGGGRLVVSGSGFRPGNKVLISGVPAQVRSITANQIVADAPTMAQATAVIDEALDIVVLDTDTLGQTSIPAAVRYTPASDVMQLVSAPTELRTGHAATTPFTVVVLASDGVAPVSGTTVTFQVLSGTASFPGCPGSNGCTGVTAADGTVSVSVEGTALGPVTLQAVENGGGPSLQLTINDLQPRQSAQFVPDALYLAEGASGSWTAFLQLQEEFAPAAAVAVQWSDSTGVQPALAETTDASGQAAISFTANQIAATASGTVTGCAWNALCSGWTLHVVDASQWQIAPIDTGVPATASAAATLATTQLLVTDGLGHPLQGAPVTIYQRVLDWEGPCLATARCPAAAVLKASQSSFISGADGTISFDPLQIAGRPQVIEIAASTGLSGFLTITLTKTP